MAYLLYVIEFPNGKRYFGITSKTMRERWRRHCGDARRGSKLLVHRAMLDFGIDGLSPQVLVLGEKTEIACLEIEFIRFFETTDRSRGYNVGFGGEISPMLSPDVAIKHKGKRHSADTLRKMSKPHKMTEEGSRILRELRTGSSLSEKTKDKIRVKRADQVITEESNLKRSAKMKGRTLSKETRMKMSIARKEHLSSSEYLKMLEKLAPLR